MTFVKIQCKIGSGVTEQWVHFCYVLEEVKKRFDGVVNINGRASGDWLLKWAGEDYGVTEIITPEDLEELKLAIRDTYRDKYPEIYLESNTDSQGWLRVWFTHHMEKELELYE